MCVAKPKPAVVILPPFYFYCALPDRCHVREWKKGRKITIKEVVEKCKDCPFKRNCTCSPFL